MDHPDLRGKSVLISGGTGSFGQNFVRRLLAASRNLPERIIIFSRDEQKQEQMAREFSNKAMRYFIGDVRDEARLEMAMNGVDYVIHAAALKIVPTAEYNPIEAVRTNIMGSENVIRAAIRTGVKKVIALSTDKAVSPINLYGATKLAAEKLFIAANNLSAGRTAFSVVRYGNVVGSRGSVLPYFKKLKAEGKPLTVTNPTMTRFWITLYVATSFVYRCLGEAKGREIFVPTMPSMRIMDLVKALDCEHIIVGIRPGEKLHETLITEDESRICEYRTDAAPSYYVLSESNMKQMPEFRYSSDTNEHWASVDDLKAWMEIP